MKKYKILFTPESLQEIKDIVKWYNGEQKNLGNKFKSYLQKELHSLKSNPYSRTVRYNEIRFAVTKKFPYAAHYTIDESKACIIVQAVLAFKQNPESFWKK